MSTVLSTPDQDQGRPAAAPPAPPAPAAVPSIAAKWVLFTPETATTWLSRMPRNRNLSEGYAQEISKSMAKGQWSDTGDTVKRDKYGNLLDGQHRLRAIVISEIPRWLLAVEGLEPEAQDDMDQGRRRTLGNVLELHGVSQGSQVAAALKWVVAIKDNNVYEDSDGREGKPLKAKNERTLQLKLTPAEVFAAYQANPRLGDSLRVGQKMKDEAPFRFPPSLATALHYLFSVSRPEPADEFFGKLITGSGLVEGHVIWVLHDQLVRNSARELRRSSIDLAEWVIKAWRMYVSNETRTARRVITNRSGKFPVLPV